MTFGDFEWDGAKAAVNAAKHGVTFEEAATILLDLDYLLVRDAVVPERFIAIGMSRRARVLFVVHCERASESVSSVRVAPHTKSARPMNEDDPIEPSPESLAEIPEQDFTGAIRPNRYANLRGAFQHAVFVDRSIWEHFGSEESILDALRLLVAIAEKRQKRTA